MWGLYTLQTEGLGSALDPLRTFAFVAREIRFARSQPANWLVRDKLISLSKKPTTGSTTPLLTDFVGRW